MSSAVAGHALNAGVSHAKAVVASYARVDFLRPHFDVAPRDVRARLLASLVPRIRRGRLVGESARGGAEERDGVEGLRVGDLDVGRWSLAYGRWPMVARLSSLAWTLASGLWPVISGL